MASMGQSKNHGSRQRRYLDVGSNIGVQVRKLFEPELYPDAKEMITLFDELFVHCATTRGLWVCLRRTDMRERRDF